MFTLYIHYIGYIFTRCVHSVFTLCVHYVFTLCVHYVFTLFSTRCAVSSVRSLYGHSVYSLYRLYIHTVCSLCIHTVCSLYIHPLLHQVRCEFSEHGCEETLRLSDLSRHLRGCGYQPVTCPNPQCDVTLCLRELHLHETEVRQGIGPDPPENCHLNVKKLPKT